MHQAPMTYPSHRIGLHGNGDGTRTETKRNFRMEGGINLNASGTNEATTLLKKLQGLPHQATTLRTLPEV